MELQSIINEKSKELKEKKELLSKIETKNKEQ